MDLRQIIAGLQQRPMGGAPGMTLNSSRLMPTGMGMTPNAPNLLQTMAPPPGMLAPGAALSPWEQRRKEMEAVIAGHGSRLRGVQMNGRSDNGYSTSGRDGAGSFGSRSSSASRAGGGLF